MRFKIKYLTNENASTAGSRADRDILFALELDALAQSYEGTDITELDLTGEDDSTTCISLSRLEQLFIRMPPSVTEIDLRRNNLHRFPTEQFGNTLENAFTSLPLTVTKLDLSSNGLENSYFGIYYSNQIDKILAVLSETVSVS